MCRDHWGLGFGFRGLGFRGGLAQKTENCASFLDHALYVDF